MMETIYFAGALYGSSIEPEFRAVSPTRGLPYVYADQMEAEAAFRLMRHHCALYVTQDLKTAQRVQRGDIARIPGDVAKFTPQVVELPYGVIASLREAFQQKYDNRQAQSRVHRAEAEGQRKPLVYELTDHPITGDALMEAKRLALEVN